NALKNRLPVKVTTRLETFKEQHFDLIILAVSDDSIQKCAQEFLNTDSILIHTSGNYQLPLGSKQEGSIWPIYSINKNHLPDIKNIPVCCTGNNDSVKKAIHILAEELTEDVFWIEAEQKPWLHLCAVLGNNFIHHILIIMSEILEQKKIPKELLGPILTQTIALFSNSEIKYLQTGPAARGDEKTMNTHIEMLHSNPEIAQLYKAISKS